MPTTTNFGWTTPADTDLVKDGAAAIRTLAGNIDTSLVDLKGGTTGQFLSKNSNSDLDFVFATPSLPVNDNLIINGNFAINQRAYVSAANLASGSYGFDRWKSNFTNTTLTYTSAPAGQSITINSGGGLQQIVEQANVPAGTYTLSFSGTATGRIYNVGATPPSYAASPISFTADGLANVTVEFTATGATKTLSKVKLELGSTATTYVYAGGTFQGELAACQRYYYRVVTGTNLYFAQGGYYNSGFMFAGFDFKTTMRGTPSLVVTSGTDYYMFERNSGSDGLNDFTISRPNVNGSMVLNSSQASGTAGDVGYLFTNNAAAFIAFDAEL